jgi:hypothetical protein
VKPETAVASTGRPRIDGGKSGERSFEVTYKKKERRSWSCQKVALLEIFRQSALSNLNFWGALKFGHLGGGVWGHGTAY